MNFNKVLLSIGTLLLLISGLASAKMQEFPGHTCKPSSAIPGTPASCETDCWFVCVDPIANVTVRSGGCEPGPGTCTEFQVKYATTVYLRCDCPFLGGLCTDEGFYFAGSQWTDHCVGSGSGMI